ncbi:heavy-metal-associated domain-containing protein [Arthrobacter sp. MMS18-M83]|uniref:heavy-metal-associated domain-containing protein n=1 Tax=Arthrobacter sp. MMS18-M83 TaxID=2996261 RepID=UPI00227D3E2D|nr:heavy metal-associated domain-containing protein [Arthrobacter sp. MMS18-M83]WAH98174.1 heavy metal-associated domain-containing protein [Arthrobacter sp. MMS18-M83]
MGTNSESTWNPGPAVITLQVEGMSCTGCEHRIGNTLRRVEGVREATADHTTGRVRVRVGPGVEPETLAAKIAAAGYTVTDAETGTDTGPGEEL